MFFLFERKNELEELSLEESTMISMTLMELEVLSSSCALVVLSLQALATIPPKKANTYNQILIIL